MNNKMSKKEIDRDYKEMAENNKIHRATLERNKVSSKRGTSDGYMKSKYKGNTKSEGGIPFGKPPKGEK